MARVLITGTNRGIGFGLANQYLEAGWRVEACCRSPEKASALHELQKKAPDRFFIHRLELADFTVIDKLPEAIGGESLDLLICSAGVYLGMGRSLGQIDYSECEQSFLINTLAPIKVTEVLLPLLEKGENPKVVTISSRMGSIGDNSSGGSYAYRISKAALNITTRDLAFDLQPRGITAVTMHPGWVSTDMGGKSAPLETEECVAGIQQVIENLKPEDSGRFLLHTTGETVPW
jgi:NAD(P)-dependent dehydrogenase (short-subunit alcohol dehydrogenase family)